MARCLASLAGKRRQRHRRRGQRFDGRLGPPSRSTPGCPGRLIRSPRNLGYGAGANLGARSSRRRAPVHLQPGPRRRAGRRGTPRRGARRPPRRGCGRPHAAGDRRLGLPLGPDISRISATRSGTASWVCSGRDNPWTAPLPAARRRAAPGAPRADWVSGAGLPRATRRLRAVGGFDESYFMYVEDVDLCWRLHRAGWGVSTSRLPASSTSRGAPPSRATPTGCSWPITARSCAFAIRSTQRPPTALASLRGRRPRRPARARVRAALSGRAPHRPLAPAAAYRAEGR